MSNNRTGEFSGTIVAVRAVEDCIRATHKYTEGVATMRAKHPIQGEDFPSRMLYKYYEVYPDIDLNKDMPFWDAVFAASDWLWGETLRVDVMFNYDYRSNKARVVIKDGPEAVKQLARSIPGFSDTLARVIAKVDAGSVG